MNAGRICEDAPDNRISRETQSNWLVLTTATIIYYCNQLLLTTATISPLIDEFKIKMNWNLLTKNHDGYILYAQISCEHKRWSSTGCSLNIVLFRRFFNIFRTLVSPRCQCVYTMAGRTPALQQNWQSSEKSQHLKEKTQYLMSTL